MEFVSGDPSIVRSIKQRDLLNTWLRLYAPRQRLPDLAHFHPERMADEFPDIIHCSVDRSVEPPCLTIRKDATRMIPAYTDHSKLARRLDEFVGARMATVVMPVWHTCISRALPCYTISEITDTQGRPVAYERLLLPFSNGDGVSDVIGSLKAISEDGRFEIADLMRGPGLPSQPKVRVVIDRNLSVRTSPKRATSDTVELA